MGYISANPIQGIGYGQNHGKDWAVEFVNGNVTTWMAQTAERSFCAAFLSDKTSVDIVT